MHKIKITLLYLGAVVLLAAVSYISMRLYATSVADRDIDAFFSDFRETGKLRIDGHLKYTIQNPAEVGAIIARHKDALRNFDYAKLKPELNLTLNETKVETSWHLTISFSKRNGHWYPIFFTEFAGDKEA